MNIGEVLVTLKYLKDTKTKVQNKLNIITTLILMMVQD